MTEEKADLLIVALRKYVETVIKLKEDKDFSDYRSYRNRTVNEYGPVVQELKNLLVD